MLLLIGWKCSGNRIQILLNSLVVFLFIALSPNNSFHGDTLSPNNRKLIRNRVCKNIINPSLKEGQMQCRSSSHSSWNPWTKIYLSCRPQFSIPLHWHGETKFLFLYLIFTVDILVYYRHGKSWKRASNACRHLCGKVWTFCC